MILMIILGVCSISFFKDESFSRFFTLKEIKYNGNNLRISMDGATSTTLPTSGNYYLVSYDCKSSDTEVTWNSTNYTLSVSNGNKKGGVSCYLNFQSKPKLSEMSVGSYVKYTGNNGCSGKSCEGQNANYVSDDNMGYCNSSNYKFYVNGWRVAYVKDGSAYLVSAGVPECMCTNSSGIAGTSCGAPESTSGIPKHLANLNDKALKYCNQDYAYNGVCDSTSSWNINNNDYQVLTDNIETKKTLSNCYTNYSNKGCGYNNDLIDNGGYYWFATPYSASSASAFYWRPDYRRVSNSSSNYAYGVRPVLRLQSSVRVMSGSGTYEDPYTIVNNSFSINSGNKYVNASGLSSIKLTLVGLSDVSQMCINTDSTGCSNYVAFATSYTLDWSGATDGKRTVYVYYKNSAGEIVASMNRSITVDTVAPKNNSVRISSGSTLTRTLTISSTGASKMCFSNTSSSSSNCTSWVDYATSYSWTLSAGDGSKTVYAFFKDDAGNISSTTATTTVTSTYAVDENFSDSTYDSHLTIAGSDSYPWIVSNGQFQSNNKGVSSSTSTSTIQFTPTKNATLSFDYGVSSESNYDKLTITLAGNGTTTTLVNAISGTTTGTKSNVSLTSGVTYTLTLSYKKDGSVNKNDDIGYIDNLKIQ